MPITVRRPIHHYSPTREIRWRRRVVLGLILLVSAVLQGAGGGAGIFFYFRPDLVLIVVVSWSLTEGAAGGWWAGMAGGFFLDLFTAGPLGLHTLSLAVAGWLAARASSSLYRGHLTTRILMVAAAALAAGGIYYLLLFLFGSPPAGSSAWRQIIWPRLWQTTLFSPFWLLVAGRLLGGKR
jgi:rod shape-determining protein MreD